jgi:hypothetical protein
MRSFMKGLKYDTNGKCLPCVSDYGKAPAAISAGAFICFFSYGYVRLSVLGLFLLQDIRVQESAAWFRLDSLAFEKL